MGNYFAMGLHWVLVQSILLAVSGETEHIFTPTFRKSKQVVSSEKCNDFMTLMAQRTPWKPGIDVCAKSLISNSERLVILSAQMQDLGSTLKVYTTFEDLKQVGRCGLLKKLPHVEFVYFNATELLYEYGYGEVFPEILSWNVTGYARTSDIMRLPLAHKFGHTYIDTDITFIDSRKGPFRRQFISAAVWQDVENALEITNSAFCLSKDALTDLMTYQKRRIKAGPQQYLYTELGPSMFHKVLMNSRHTFSIYSQNHPKQAEIEQIVKSVKIYSHKYLHLTTSIRKYGSMRYRQLVEEVRKRLRLKPLLLPSPSSFALPSLGRRGQKAFET